MATKKKPAQQKIPRKKIAVAAYQRQFPERLPPRDIDGRFRKRKKRAS